MTREINDGLPDSGVNAVVDQHPLSAEHSSILPIFAVDGANQPFALVPDSELIAGNYEPQTIMGDAWERYYGNILRYVTRQVGNDLAEDISSDVFLALGDALAKNQGPNRNLKSMLFYVAHNRIVTHHRQGVLRGSVYLEDVIANWHLIGSDDPALDPSHMELVAHLERNDFNLTDDQLVVLRLRFWDDLTNRDTAGIMGKSEGAIKALVHRALSVLRKEMQYE